MALRNATPPSGAAPAMRPVRLCAQRTVEMATSPPKTRQGAKHPPCIWMQAGVVPHKYCRLNYQCTACRYDRALQRLADENRGRRRGIVRQGRRAGIVHWKDRLREWPAWKQPCLHAMKGRIEFRACTNDYSCTDCEFDQFFYDQFTVHAVVKPVAELDIEGFKIPQGYYLHRGHAWAKIEEDNTVRIGLDEFAARTFGPFTRIDTPLLGKTVRQDHPGITLVREDNRAGLLSPVSGVITATNPRLLEDGRIENRDAYADDWLIRVHADNLRRDLKQLMISHETAAFLAEEVERLYEVIETAAGPLTVDGGRLGSDIYGKLPQLDWRRLARTFLRTE
jgi:glycine cleavage system H lipoate-binding protein